MNLAWRFFVVIPRSIRSFHSGSIYVYMKTLSKTKITKINRLTFQDETSARILYNRGVPVQSRRANLLQSFKKNSHKKG